MKRGFSMIELIFVIVILGILASVALPKLAATRDDAMISGLLEDVSNLQKSIPAYVMAQNRVSIRNAVQVSGWIDGCDTSFTNTVQATNLSIFKSVMAGDLKVCIDVNTTSIAQDPALRVKFYIKDRDDIASRLSTALGLDTAITTGTGTKDMSTPDISVPLKGISISW